MKTIVAVSLNAFSQSLPNILLPRIFNVENLIGQQEFGNFLLIEPAKPLMIKDCIL